MLNHLVLLSPRVVWSQEVEITMHLHVYSNLQDPLYTNNLLMKMLLFTGTNEDKLHIRFISWTHEHWLSQENNLIASPFLTLLLTFTSVTILYLKSIKPDFLCLWTFEGFLYLPVVSIIKCRFSNSCVNGGKLERFFVHCMDVSVSWPPFSISFLNKGKTHQQLRADCWVLKVVNSSCSNFYVAGNNSWSKAKNKAKTAQTIETTSTITKTTKRRKTLVRQNGYFPAKHLFFVCVYSKWQCWLEHHIVIQRS